jgi:hypothetical protein
MRPSPARSTSAHRARRRRRDLSGTKYLNGHNDVIAGGIAGTAAIVEEVIQLMRLWGPAIDPHRPGLNRGMRRCRANGAKQPERNGRCLVGGGTKGISRVHYRGSFRPITRWRRGPTASAAWWNPLAGGTAGSSLPQTTQAGDPRAEPGQVEASSRSRGSPRTAISPPRSAPRSAS